MSFNSLNETEKEGYENRYFLGVVINNADPLQLQRIKVSIPNLMEFNSEDSYWIAPKKACSVYTKGPAGEVSVPSVGAEVMIEFQDGDLSAGLYSASFNSSSRPIPAPLATNYPRRRGWVDDSGNHFWVDTTPGSVEIHVRHFTGTTIRISNDGSVHITTDNEVNVQAETANVVCTSEANLTSPDTNITGNVNITGNTQLTGNFAASGGTFTHNGIPVGSNHRHGPDSRGDTQTIPLANP